MAAKEINKEELLRLIDDVELPGIRSGQVHKFTPVWMVTMNGRMFCRSGRYVPSDSWYDAFQREPQGAIQLNEIIVKVTAKIPEDLERIGEDINQAYYKKYGGKYPHLIAGIATEKLMRHTMEFLVESDEKE